MSRALATFAGLFGLLLPLLALAPVTAWLAVPVHALLTGLALTGIALSTRDGRLHGLRGWVGGHLASTLAWIAALGWTGSLRGDGPSWLPWLLVLGWGWLPGALATVAGPVAAWRNERLERSVRARRRRDRALGGDGSWVGDQPSATGNSAG